MTKQKFITPAEAAEVHFNAGHGTVHYFTILEWIKKYGLGIKVGGRWRVDAEKFDKFLRTGTYERAEYEKAEEKPDQAS